MQKLTITFLRIGLAFPFIYVALSSFVKPDSWVGYFPAFTADFIDPYLALKLFSAFELLLGAWLLVGKNVYLPSLISAVLLVAILLFNLSQMDVLFRDVSLLFISFALMTLSAERKPNV